MNKRGFLPQLIVLGVVIMVLIFSLLSLRNAEKSLQITKESREIAMESRGIAMERLRHIQDSIAFQQFSRLLVSTELQILGRSASDEVEHPYTIYYTLGIDGKTEGGKCIFADKITCELDQSR